MFAFRAMNAAVAVTAHGDEEAIAAQVAATSGRPAPYTSRLSRGSRVAGALTAVVLAAPLARGPRKPGEPPTEKAHGSSRSPRWYAVVLALAASVGPGCGARTAVAGGEVEDAGAGACQPTSAECEPSETASEPCGSCGTRARACSDDCLWLPWSACIEPPTCEPVCDLDGDGHLSADCGGDDCDDTRASVHPGLVEEEAWSVEVIEDTWVDVVPDFATSIAIDSVGTVHVAYGSDGLRHARRGGDDWQVETVDDTTEVLDASVAIDAADGVHIGYVDAYSEEARHATSAGGEWVVEPAAPGAYWETSLGLGPDGTAHLAFCDRRLDVWYASNRSGAWEAQLVSEVAAHNASLAVGPDGVAHIAHTDEDSFDVTWATDATGAWTRTVIGSGRGEASIAIGASGAAYVAYESLLLATNRTGRWESQTIDEIVGTLDGKAIALDAADGVHVAYVDEGIRVATNARGSWETSIAEDDVEGLMAPSIAVSRDRVVHVAYRRYTVGDVRYARRSVPDGLDDDCDGTAL